MSHRHTHAIKDGRCLGCGARAEWPIIETQVCSQALRPTSDRHRMASEKTAAMHADMLARVANGETHSSVAADYGVTKQCVQSVVAKSRRAA